MSLALVHSRATIGVDAVPVTVEVHLTNGLPGLSIVGLPEAAVRESKDRVRSAIINSEFEFPRRKITINLAPADLPKEGGRYDLAIAVGILAASKQLPAKVLNDYEFLGELALSGELRPINGVLPASLACQKKSRTLFVAECNGEEACLIPDAKVKVGKHLLDICADLVGQNVLPFASNTPAHDNNPAQTIYGDFNEVKSQERAKRALEIAAAGGHNLIMYGPPGTGKSMLASRLPSILPPLSENEAIEVAAIYSIQGKQAYNTAKMWGQRPFRHPHHTASAVALVGGGSSPKPGEISLAHHGVLFLDELPEFDRRVLEVLREPLESGEVHISRAAQQVCFPAKFQLIAAMNPCPCGYHGDSSGRCRCTEDQVLRYRSKLSGPLLDRIDIHVEVPSINKRLFLGFEENELKGAVADKDLKCSSALIQKRIVRCHQLQLDRQGKSNSALQNKELALFCDLSKDCQALIENAVDRLNLSPRAINRLFKISRTIADLEVCDGINLDHIAEAISFRSLNV